MGVFAVIGAGKTGRGFIGRLLAQEEKRILFIDKDEGTVEKLNAAGSYLVRFFGGARPSVRVKNYSAVTWREADLSDAELIFVAVGGSNLADVGAQLKGRLPDNARVITCENAMSPAKKLKDAIGNSVFVSEATVFCTTVEDEGTDIISEDYDILQCDAAALGDWSTDLKWLTPLPEFGNFLTRKLYTYNAASCVIAYLGWYYGYTDYAAAANDPRISLILDRNYESTGMALCAEYGYDREDQARFSALSRKKFRDGAIADTVARNARDPKRKLAAGERVTGPMRLMEKYGRDTAALEMTAAAMLLYDGDDGWNKVRSAYAPERILKDIAGIDPAEPLGGRILKRFERMRRLRSPKSLYGLDDIIRQRQSLNGLWQLRVGEGALRKVQVPYSALPVGVSRAALTFDRKKTGKRAFLVFDGITYAATVSLNGRMLGDMLAYGEYRFEITDLIRDEGNRLEVEIRDIDPPFGPASGWQNYGGIIRDVWIEYVPEAYLADVAWSTTFPDGYDSARCLVETEVDCRIERTGESAGEELYVEAFLEDSCGRQVASSRGGVNAPLEFVVKNPSLWSPESPCLYTLRCALLRGEKIIDVKSIKVGFKDFTAKGRRFYLNGEPFFLFGVCRHDLYGDKGHTLSEEDMRRDMTMIKQTGANYVRLVHYPHHRRIVELADELGLLVSEEPGLWWSDMHDRSVCEAAMEILSRTIKRDRSHVSIAFWLCFNECEFTVEYLREAAAVCRGADPRHMVSGANCMGIEMTKDGFLKAGLDFYTMHPYSPKTDRMIESAAALTEKPLLFTEWGGYYCTDNPRFFRECIDTLIDLWRNGDSDDLPAIAGASFWSWAEYNEFRRSDAAKEGVNTECLVDMYRNPTENLHIFTEGFAKLWLPSEDIKCGVDFAAEFECDGEAVPIDLTPYADVNADAWNKMLSCAKSQSGASKAPGRHKKAMENGPVLSRMIPALGKIPVRLLSRPIVLTEDELLIPVGRKVRAICVFGNVSFPKGFPTGGLYGENVAVYTVRYADGGTQSFEMKNGMDVTTADGLYRRSRIEPTAANSPRALRFSYDKEWEQYVMNARRLNIDPEREVESVGFRGAAGYMPLLYGVSLLFA